ncbi:hypothetical protein LSH36_757g00007 [Paralvinella palmiformis]|uniref:Uncharacterized protein n=1 Tax=Paralvinella palmiformis TaxID=53620 RepID=A0AAD9J1L3_9ANNE|nr:hypothetical protein LSH36_757g00007 [Paralvinella palmiformis]
MLNASIPEDPETASDLEPYAVSDIEADVKVETVKGQNTHTDTITLPPKVQPEPEMESEVMKYEDFRFEALDKEPGGTRFVKHESGGEKEISKHAPPLPFNSPPVTKLEEPQLSPRSDTSSKSSRKVVSVKENLRNEHGDMIEMITTTVIKHEVPQAEVAVRETVAPTDDLSFGDSTFDDLDELVLQNMQVNAPSELPPPPPELMNTSGSQELLNSLADQSNKITVHAEQVGDNEEVRLIKSGKLKKKSKKSTENLAGAAELEQKKKKKKKKKLKTAESDKKKTEDIQVEDSPKEDIDLENYDQEPGLIKPKKVKGIATVLALGDGIPLKPSEVKSLQDARGQVKLRQDTRHKRDGTAGEELNEQNEELKDYNNESEKYQYSKEEQIRQQRTAEMDDIAESKVTGKQRPQTDVNQSMTDIEVAQITDAAEARRKAREAARAQRLWHKKMIEEGKDPRLVLKSRSHSRETSDDQRNQSPSPTRKRVMPSPDSYSITVEGNAEVTTSQGMRLSVRSQKAQDEQKQRRQPWSQRWFGGWEKRKKKKKKKKTGSQDELVSVVTPNIDDLAPKGTVQGAPPETVISDIWKEAMEGQPLASSETVYEEQPLDSNSEVRRSRRGRKLKRSSNDNRPQPIMQINLQESLEDEYADDVTTEPSLQGLIRPATVPDVNRSENAHYDSSSEDDLEKESENILSVELTAAERVEMEARKKQQKLIRLGRKYKLTDGGIVHDELHQQEQERQTTDDKSPKLTKQPHKKVGLQHAIELQQAEEHSSEGSVGGTFARQICKKS